MAMNPLLKSLINKSQAKYAGNAGKAVKLKGGRNVLRVIVPAPGQTKWVGDDGKFWRDLGVHWIKADMTAKPTVVLGCSQIVYDTPSTIAAVIDQAIASAHDEDLKALYQEWTARKSVLINVILRANGDEPEVLELTPTTFGKILDLIELYEGEGIDILDAQSGMDIVITKDGTGLNTTYEVAVLPLAPGKTFKPVSDDQIDRAEDLDRFIESNYFRGEEQKALNTIAQITGIRVPQLGAPVTPTAALSSPAASTADAAAIAAKAAAEAQAANAKAAAVAAAQAAAAQAAAAAAAPAAKTPLELAQEQLAKLQAEAAAAAPVKTPLQLAQEQLAAAQAAAAAAAPATPVTPEQSMSDLDADQQDALLAELNSIGA